MKVILFYSLTVMMVHSAMGQNLIIGSYNLRYDNPKDTGNLWQDRRAAVIALIRFHEFDIFGTQEGLKNQIDDINSSLPYYSRSGVGRDDGKDKGEHSAIFYKNDRFELLKNGDFWLSETPDKPSLGWDAICCYRICSWVYLRDKKSGKKFFFFNVHYDHQGVVARKESSKLILEKIKNIAGNEAVIFTGDFNGAPNTEWYKTIANSTVLSDTYDHAKFPYANNGSFNAFGSRVESNEIIDHIFISKQFSAVRWGILTDTYHGKFPSDHFPVLTELSLK
ncbi:MAG: endonuclease/exonuclease/phosphatase family protein [Ginsengibacter sp.]